MRKPRAIRWRIAAVSPVTCLSDVTISIESIRTPRRPQTLSLEEWTRLTSELVAGGTLVQLDESKKPNSFWCASDPTDVARVEDRTFICSRDPKDAGAKARDLCRKLGVSEHTFYRWRSKYGGMEVSDARKLKALEEENRRLKHIVADLTLDNQMLKAINTKKW